MAKVLNGKVVKNSSNKTIKVAVTTSKTHPIYKKRYIKTNHFLAHDEDNQAVVGDKVEITESRPISARKTFVLTKITEKTKISAKDRVEAVAEVEVAKEEVK
jgi:small subunit ribosomal protein S17